MVPLGDGAENPKSCGACATIDLHGLLQVQQVARVINNRRLESHVIFSQQVFESSQPWRGPRHSGFAFEQGMTKLPPTGCSGRILRQVRLVEGALHWTIWLPMRCET